jgi:hypothetical protein
MRNAQKRREVLAKMATRETGTDKENKRQEDGLPVGLKAMPRGKSRPAW